MHLIIDSIENRNVQMISGVYLGNYEHAPIFYLNSIVEYLLDFLEVFWRGPGIGINYCYHYIG